MLATKYLEKLRKLNSLKLRKELKETWDEAKLIIQQNGDEEEFIKTINTMFRTNLTGIAQIDEMSKKLTKDELTESRITDFWTSMKSKFMAGLELKDTYVKKISDMLSRTATKVQDKVDNVKMATKATLVTAGILYKTVKVILWIMINLERYKKLKKTQKSDQTFIDKTLSKFTWMRKKKPVTEMINRYMER
jgi:hypothetical protein